MVSKDIVTWPPSRSVVSGARSFWKSQGSLRQTLLAMVWCTAPTSSV